jgi:hypothetical protein
VNCYINSIIRCPFPVPPTIPLLGPDVDHLRFVALFFVGVAVVLALTAVGWLEALLSLSLSVGKVSTPAPGENDHSRGSFCLRCRSSLPGTESCLELGIVLVELQTGNSELAFCRTSKRGMEITSEQQSTHPCNDEVHDEAGQGKKDETRQLGGRAVDLGPDLGGARELRFAVAKVKDGQDQTRKKVPFLLTEWRAAPVGKDSQSAAGSQNSRPGGQLLPDVGFAEKFDKRLFLRHDMTGLEEPDRLHAIRANHDRRRPIGTRVSLECILP